MNVFNMVRFKAYGKACAEVAQQKYIESRIPNEKRTGIYSIFPSERKMIEALGISDEAYIKGKYSLYDSD